MSSADPNSNGMMTTINNPEGDNNDHGSVNIAGNSNGTPSGNSRVHKLINVKNTKGQSESMQLDFNANLEDTRLILKYYNVMTDSDRFIFNNVAVNQDSERETKLSEILKNEIELNIGAAGSINNLPGEQKYNSMNIDQKLFILGAHNLKVCNGLTIKKEDDVKLFQTYKKLYRFADNYAPQGINPPTLLAIEELYTFTEESHSMQYSGVNSASVSLSIPNASVQANYEYAKNNSQSNDELDTYLTKRYLYKKIDIFVDPTRLIVEDDFLHVVRNAVRGFERSIDGYTNLVNVLNEYGWYIPIQYTLGGAIYSTKISKVRTLAEARMESHNFGARVDASYMNIRAGIGINHKDSSNVNNTTKTNNDSLMFRQIGGNGVGQDNLMGWIDSLDDANNWRIIRYTNLMPSLMLLHGVDSITLSNAMKLLTKYNSYSEVRSLQPHINIQEYENVIAYDVNPAYSK